MANNNENKILNVPTKREQCQTCLGNAERAEQVTKVKPKGNVPNLRFPEFTEEWRIKTIFDACTLYNGRAYKQEELLSTGKYRVLRVGNFFTNDSWYYSNLELDDFKTVVNGDLLYAWSASFGPRFWDGEKAIYHYHIWKVIPKQHVDKFYLYHFLYKDSLIIKSRTQGGTMVHVTKGDMEKRLIQLPCIEEQKKIARLLDLIDERIATQNKIIDKLQSLIKGLAVTLTTKGKPNTAISQCLECHSSTLQESEVLPNELYKVFGANGLVGYTDVPQMNGDAILVIKDGSSVGTVSYAQGKFSVIGTLNYLTAIGNNDLRYLYFALSVFNFQSYKTGMAIPHIYFKDYGKAKIYCPPLAEQKHVANVLGKLESKLCLEQELLVSFNQQKRYLLGQMFI